MAPIETDETPPPPCKHGTFGICKKCGSDADKISALPIERDDATPIDNKIMAPEELERTKTKLVQRMTIDELEAKATALTKADRTDEANDLMAVMELRRMLVVNAERDLILVQVELRIDRLASIVFDLQVDRIEVHKELLALRGEHNALKRQQDELRARQDVIAMVIDAGIERISAITGKIQALTDHVQENSEP